MHGCIGFVYYKIVITKTKQAFSLRTLAKGKDTNASKTKQSIEVYAGVV